MSDVNFHDNFLRSLMRRQRAESIVNFYRRGNGINRLPLEEFTSQDMESNLEEDDDDNIDTPVNQEEELVRDIEQDDIWLDYIYDPEQRSYTVSTQEEEVRELAENETLRDTFDGELELDEEDPDVQKAPSEVEGILQRLSRVEINLLEAYDLKCSICHSEYGKERGDTTKQVSDVDEESSDSEAPENPVMLPCGHLFGDLCIHKWLQEPRPASCPLCRYQL